MALFTWFVDKVLPALVVFTVTTPVTMFLLNRQQTETLRDHVDDATDKQTEQLKTELGKLHAAHKPGGHSG